MNTYLQHYNASISNPSEFWKEQAAQIDWLKFPSKTFELKENGTASWFPDGQINTSYLCLDYQVANGRADQTAIIYESPVTQTQRKYTYAELLDLVSRFAVGLASK